MKVRPPLPTLAMPLGWLPSPPASCGLPGVSRVSRLFFMQRLNKGGLLKTVVQQRGLQRGLWRQRQASATYQKRKLRRGLSIFICEMETLNGTEGLWEY